jgi:hypothetical protein
MSTSFLTASSYTNANINATAVTLSLIYLTVLKLVMEK